MHGPDAAQRHVAKPKPCWSETGFKGDIMSPRWYADAMPSPKKYQTKTPVATPQEAQERYAFMDQAIRRRGFQIDELESALGMYMIGFHFGWKVLYVVHSKKTIRKYEEILGITVREVFEEYGPDADRTNAYKISQAVSSFWKLVSGDEKPSVQLDKRSLTD
jgi:hypothetical protein